MIYYYVQFDLVVYEINTIFCRYDNTGIFLDISIFHYIPTIIHTFKIIAVLRGGAKLYVKFREHYNNFR